MRSSNAPQVFALGDCCSLTSKVESRRKAKIEKATTTTSRFAARYRLHVPPASAPSPSSPPVRPPATHTIDSGERAAVTPVGRPTKKRAACRSGVRRKTCIVVALENKRIALDLLAAAASLATTAIAAHLFAPTRARALTCGSSPSQLK